MTNRVRAGYELPPVDADLFTLAAVRLAGQATARGASSDEVHATLARGAAQAARALVAGVAR